MESFSMTLSGPNVASWSRHF